MYDLEKLELQLAQYGLQKIQHQQMFHKFEGAMEVLEEMINGLKLELAAKEKEKNDGKVIDQEPGQASEE